MGFAFCAGFETAVDEAQRAINAAYVESKSFPDCVGVVKLSKYMYARTEGGRFRDGEGRGVGYCEQQNELTKT